MNLTNLDKEILLLSIIADMGGGTDASDSPHCWLNWFCNDEVHGKHSDTFNRCLEKGWLRSSHDSSFDTSTAWLTDAGKAALTAAPASAAEPVGWQYRRHQAFLDTYPQASEYVMHLYSTEYEARVASLSSTDLVNGNFPQRLIDAAIVRPVFTIDT